MASVEELKAAYDAALVVVAEKHAEKRQADAELAAARAKCIAANDAIVAAEMTANRKKTALGVAEGWANDGVTEVGVGA